MATYFGVSADYLLGRELNVVCEDNKSINVSLSVSDKISKLYHNNFSFFPIAQIVPYKSYPAILIQ